jgi:hypothetical protein
LSGLYLDAPAAPLKSQDAHIEVVHDAVRLEHDPEKWEPVLGKDDAQT